MDGGGDGFKNMMMAEGGVMMGGLGWWLSSEGGVAGDEQGWAAALLLGRRWRVLGGDGLSADRRCGWSALSLGAQVLPLVMDGGGDGFKNMMMAEGGVMMGGLGWWLSSEGGVAGDEPGWAATLLLGRQWRDLGGDGLSADR
ncbi:hypothetical protein Dimus_016365 [Dionaea muscipula]